MTIGLPRALIYWKQPYFWEVFFENLGFEVLLSPETNKEIMEMGVKNSDPENCFSNKVYWGHLLWLDGKCDLIYVPRLKATEEKLEYCPKFFGLPDLAKILVKTPILTETFDPRLRPTLHPFVFPTHPKVEISDSFKVSLEKLGKKLGKNRETVERAIEIAFLKEKELKEKEREEFLAKINSNKQKIVLISHPYNLYDEYVNLRMKEKLEKLGTQPIFIEEISLNSRINTNFREYNICDISGQIRKNSPEVKFHWEFAKEIMEKIQEILKYKTCPASSERSKDWCGISGAIEISSFACGCDAVLKEFVEREFKKNKIPFLYLIIDEHTGEAGIQTRLEAFIDTIKLFPCAAGKPRT